jgi:hypothetical protein
MKRRIVAQAALLIAGALAFPWAIAACPANSAKPFTSGPLDAEGMFSQWVVDGNGVALSICTDSVTRDGNPPPCFYDAPVIGNTLSETLGRGNEAFFYLANSVFTTTGAFPIDAVLVYGVESAFLAAEPQAGFQTQFQRMRTRINVSKVGRYTVESPWGTRVYDVTALLPDGNGQNRSEISEPLDVTFNPESSVPGLVAPFLVAEPEIPGFGRAQGYIGDGLTPTTVKGSPCGQNFNFVRITATELDGVTGIDINNGLNVYTNDQFTVMGKLAASAPAPLAITAAYVSRPGNGVNKLTVMAEGSASESASVQVSLDGGNFTLNRDGTRYHTTLPLAGAAPATVSVTATDSQRNALPNTRIAQVTDLVTISSAEARCSGTGQARSCLLTVHAESSDQSVGANAPTLTLVHTGDVLVNGAVSVNSAAVPASVVVTSKPGNGQAKRAVTLINQ